MSSTSHNKTAREESIKPGLTDEETKQEGIVLAQRTIAGK
jgi:hypothetical protein